MNFSGLVVQLLNGLAGASSLFLVGAGLSLIFGVTRIVNFAHGSFYMLGIYIAYMLTEKLGGGLWFWPALLLASLAVGVIGATAGYFLAGTMLGILIALAVAAAGTWARGRTVMRVRHVERG